LEVLGFRVEEAAHDRRGLLPTASLGQQAFAPVACQPVEARFAIIL
jgi:hypothetical protein